MVCESYLNVLKTQKLREKKRQIREDGRSTRQIVQDLPGHSKDLAFTLREVVALVEGFEQGSGIT